MAAYKVLIWSCVMFNVWRAFGNECAGNCEDNDLVFLYQVNKIPKVALEAASTRTTADLGSATAEIDGSKASCRDHQCASGKLLCDELLRFAREEKPSTTVHMALYNGGGIRASIPQGTVTEEHINATHPYGNEIFVATVPGSAVTEMLTTALSEHGAPGNGSAGNWVQAAGMSFKAVWSGESWTQLSVTVGGVALQDGADYTIVTNQYIMDGNGGRKAISGSARDIDKLSKTVPVLMRDYFVANTPVSPPTLMFGLGTLLE